MMKRLFSIAVLLLALVIPAVSFAQDNTSGAVWDLTQTFTVTDLGFNFLYPADWVYDTSNGITLAKSQDDIDLYNDNDNSTQPNTEVITINALKAADLEAQAGKNPTLEDIADLAVKIGDIKETEARVEIPVMSRRTLSVIGTSNTTGRSGFATIWRQGEFVVLATITAPSMKDLIHVSYSWGQILGSMTPTDALPLSTTPTEVTNGNFEISLPQKWYPSPDNPQLIFESKDDMKKNAYTGEFMAVVVQSLKDAGLTSKSTLDDAVKANINSFGLQEPITREEFIILDKPAITIRGADSSGQWAMITQALVDNQLVTGVVSAPSEDQLNQLEPTWLAVLKSITPLTTPSTQ